MTYSDNTDFTVSCQLAELFGELTCICANLFVRLVSIWGHITNPVTTIQLQATHNFVLAVFCVSYFVLKTIKEHYPEGTLAWNQTYSFLFVLKEIGCFRFTETHHVAIMLVCCIVDHIGPSFVNLRNLLAGSQIWRKHIRYRCKKHHLIVWDGKLLRQDKS